MSDDLNERSITLIRICRCGLVFAAGICACGVAITTDHTFEATRPSDMKCIQSEVRHDLAPPVGCDDNPSQHSRLGWSYNLNTTVSSSSTNAIYSSGIITIIDAEDAAEHHTWYDHGDRGGSIPHSTTDLIDLGRSITFYLVRPTMDERLTLIPLSSKSS